MRIILSFFAFFAPVMSVFAQIPAKPQEKPVVIFNAEIHTGNGKVITNGCIAFDKGKIIYVGNEKQNIGGAEEIDATGKKVYPGLILTASRIGLAEIEAVRATLDYSETGEFNPNVRALIAYNTDSELIPTLKDTGILTIHTSPRGGIISGMSSVMRADGWNWEDAAMKTDDGIFFNFPSTYTVSGWWGDGINIEADKQRAERLKRTREFFAAALAYTQTTPSVKNLKFEAMRGLFDGSKTLFIKADFGKDITESVLFAREFGIKKIAVWGAQEAHLITDFLKRENVSIILERVFDLPMRNDDGVSSIFELPAILEKAGVQYCISFAGNSEPMNARNLPFGAGYAAAYGLTKEQALSAITLYPAKILGIDDKTGSLETGKLADIVISEGDILDMRGNKIVRAFIEGKNIDLDNRQRRLYEKFKAKYEGK
jgi:imidazolonepropionase-like amidohydrolase